MKKLKRQLKNEVKLNEPLKRYTTFRIGGPVEAHVEPRGIEDLRKVLKFARAARKHIFIAGSGSNLLVTDKKLKGVVIRLGAPFFKRIEVTKRSVTAGSGASLRDVLKVSTESGLSGLEFSVGIPGTIGGAVMMNTGSTPRSNSGGIGDLVDSLVVMERTGRIKNLTKRNLRFGYRSSSFEGLIILYVRLALQKSNKPRIKQKIKRVLDKKKKTQDLSRPSAGCVFKNPCGGYISAGSLIELAGLKGKRLGGAQVSRKHANYIVNLGGATFRDVEGLIDLIKKKVNEEFSIMLEPEVKIWK